MNPKAKTGISWGQVAFLFFATLFIRLPFFFRDLIDHDESTFILMGQSIVDGYLPYVHLWDLKPPLLFYIFGLVEYLFPHSFVAVRFTGVLVCFISAVLLMGIARKIKFRNPFIIAVLYVVFSSEFGNIQGLMSEHLAVMFLLVGFHFLFKGGTGLSVLLAGIGFGCSLLCKLNYSYALAALPFVYLYLNWKHQGLWKIFRWNALLVSGILLPFAIAFLPYLVTRQEELFFNSVFLAPLEYNHTQYTLAEKWKKTWILIVAGLAISFFSWRMAPKEQRGPVIVFTLFLLATIYTLFQNRILNTHYLILIYPFILLMVFGVMIKKEFQFRWVYVLLFVLLVSMESHLEYYRLIKAYRQNGSLFNGPAFQVTRELRKRNLDREKIFFGDYHIGYWILDQYPLTRSMTHPSNLRRSFLFKYFNASATSMDELKYIMEEIKPCILVSKYPYLSFFEAGSPENQYFNQLVNQEFRMLFHDEKNKIYVWQRK